MKQPGHMFPLLLATLCLAIPANLDAADPPARVPWTTSRVTGTPEGPSPYLTERAFPKLAFKTPVELVRIPGSKRLLVAELSGKLLSFPDDQSVSSTDLVLDLKKHLPKLSHLYGVTFHPKFETNRTCFISYVFGGAPDGSKVSRFKMTDADPPTIDPGSEQVLITWPSGGHNGAAIRFGPDGYLYISTGDGVGPNPPDPKNNGQDCSNLFSSILRIDVDRHDPGRAYRIPPENPLVGIEGLRTEIWAYGFRNPWKISFDPRRGDLWVGDVGWELWEMVYRVVKGGNYGWSIVEGPQPVNTHLTRGPTPILPPTVAHPHSEAASITGGIVYYGSKLPDLSGEYVYGDYETGKLWALKWDGKQVSRLREISDTALRIICFGADTSNELLFMGHTAGTIHRLVDNPDRDQPGRFPKRLSETGLFSSVTDHRYASGVVAYRVAAEPWADGAITRRAVALPGASTIRTKGQWSFPTGSVLLKTISLELTPGDAASRRRIETQLLHFDGQGWRGYGYRWNDNQSDAELVDAAGVDVPFEVRDSSAGGGQRRQTHHFAARVECVRCHNKWSGDALAFNTAGLDVPDARDPAVANQLDQLSGLGLFDPPLKAGAKPPLVDPYNSDHSLEARSRSWLQVNCAHCHRMHAGSSVLAYMHHDLPLAKTLLIDTKPSQGTFGIPEARIVAPGDRLTGSPASPAAIDRSPATPRPSGEPASRPSGTCDSSSNQKASCRRNCSPASWPRPPRHCDFNPGSMPPAPVSATPHAARSSGRRWPTTTSPSATCSSASFPKSSGPGGSDG